MTTLSLNEQKIYECIGMSRKTTKAISDETGFNSTLVRSCLTAMTRKKVISHSTDGQRMFYTRARPAARPTQPRQIKTRKEPTRLYRASGKSQLEIIVEALEQAGPRGLNGEEIAKKTGISYASAEVAVSRLRKQEDVVTYGRYRQGLTVLARYSESRA